MIDSLASFWDVTHEKLPFAMEGKKGHLLQHMIEGMECNCVPVEISNF